jgi:hypothetical protein
MNVPDSQMARLVNAARRSDNRATPQAEPASPLASAQTGTRLAATVFAVGGAIMDMVLVTVDALRGRYDC